MQGLKGVQVREQEVLREALASGYVTDWRLAIDGGAHVGGWTAILADYFDVVHAFEPAPDTFELLQRNVSRPEVRLYQLALMDKQTTCALQRGGRTTTARQFEPREGGDILAVDIDQFRFKSCGFLKLDLEGCELFALKGARKTIKRHHPFVMVEMAGLGERFDITDEWIRGWLKHLGYRQVLKSGVDEGFQFQT